MATPLVATKVHAPRLRHGLVGRRMLLERLLRGGPAHLILISAPAGFGKTTLLAELVASSTGAGRSVAWLSLDRADNELFAFWGNLVAALRTAVPGIGETLLSLVQSGQELGEPGLATLLNELGETPADIDLVLDDYHAIDRPEIAAGMTYLLDHLPPNVRLAIGTRSDPALPLSRLRARGELVEMRAADLRFTPEEAAAYLIDARGLNLTRENVATLLKRTEGWIAALQLAALSMERREDITEFIASFAGNDRYIVDYLVDEVLQRQKDDVRRFLIRTCFLERLSGPLCDAVTGESGGAAMLDTLERANLFVVPLDARREWYRYHHMFADVLQAHFADEVRDELPSLHRRAGDWFDAHDAPAEAVEHAFAANDVERAAELIERMIPALSRNRQEATFRAWLERLPDGLVRRRPVLGIGMVGALVTAGALDGIEDRLRDAETAVATLNADDLSAVVDRGQLAAVPGAIELYRAALAQVRGDIPAIIEHAERSISLAPPDEHFGRAGAQGFLGIAYWTRGELDVAERAWLASREGLRRAGRFADVLGTSIALASISVTLGRLRAATRTLEDVLELGMAQRVVPRGTADVLSGLGELYRLSGDLDLASQHLVKSEELASHAGLVQHPYRWCVAMAHLRHDEGDDEGALDLLDEAERVLVGEFFPIVRPIPAMKARILIRLGRLDEASRWQAGAGIGATDELTYLREFEHITLARLLLAEKRLDGPAGGLALLDRLLDAAERGRRMGSVIEISILQALALRATGDAGPALASLGRALELAAPESFVTVFLAEGEPMAALLKAAARKDMSPAYARSLLAAFENGDSGRVLASRSGELHEPLSERELDVLRLLRSDLDGPGISRELGLSLNTVRTHTKNIYEKLDVNSRRAAVRRAEELDLLQRR